MASSSLRTKPRAAAATTAPVSAPADAPAIPSGALSDDEQQALALPSEQQARAQQMANEAVDAALAYDLDELTPLPIVVAIREHTVSDEGGIVRNTWRTRHAQIETFVPMKCFNRMWALRETALAERPAWREYIAKLDDDAEDDEVEDDPIFKWHLACVWSVWRLTEPSITIEQLRAGLSFKQVQGLFARFFGDALRQSNGNR